MAAAGPGEQLAKVAVLFVVVAALNALRRGELADWGKAKFLNWGDPTPSSNPTLASVLGGTFTSTGDAIGGAGDTIAGGVDAALDGVAGIAPAGLVNVGTTRMSARFAAKWRPLAAKAAAEGVILTGGAWRSNAEQIRLRTAHGCGGSRLYDRSCRGNPPTAVPGRSRHETGDAIDVKLTGGGGRNSPEYKWLAANARAFGVYNLPSEPWHWSIDGS